jgi:hypothetical protein
MARLKNTTVSNADAITLPRGLGAEKNSVPASGDLFYNTDVNLVQVAADNKDGDTIWHSLAKPYTANLIFWYDFGEVTSYLGGSAVTDLSGNGYNGDIQDSEIVFDGVDKKSIAFDTGGDAPADDTSTGIFIENFHFVNSGATTDSRTSMSELTVEAWCKANSTNTTNTLDARILLSYDRSSAFRFGVGNDVTSDSTGKLAFQYYNTTSGILDTYAINQTLDLRDDKWHHVAVTLGLQELTNGSRTLIFYVDGKTVTYLDETDHSQLAYACGTSSAETPRYGYIGTGSEESSAGGGGSAFPADLWYGNIGLMRFYEKALEPGQISKNYHAERQRFV